MRRDEKLVLHWNAHGCMRVCVCVLYTAIWDYPKDVMQPYVNARQMNFTNYSSHCTTPFKIKCQIHTFSRCCVQHLKVNFARWLFSGKKRVLSRLIIVIANSSENYALYIFSLAWSSSSAFSSSTHHEAMRWLKVSWFADSRILTWDQSFLNSNSRNSMKFYFLTIV